MSWNTYRSSLVPSWCTAQCLPVALVPEVVFTFSKSPVVRPSFGSGTCPGPVLSLLSFLGSLAGLQVSTAFGVQLVLSAGVRAHDSRRQGQVRWQCSPSQVLGFGQGALR